VGRASSPPSSLSVCRCPRCTVLYLPVLPRWHAVSYHQITVWGDVRVPSYPVFRRPPRILDGAVPCALDTTALSAVDLGCTLKVRAPRGYNSLGGVYMVTETGQPAPYAPVRNVLAVITRLRERGLPDRLGIQELTSIGIPAGNASRTLAALRFLGLLDNEGQRNPIFERLRRATSEEYPAVLAEILRSAYAPIFTIVDPAQDDEGAVQDAFRQYEPQAQRARMVTLFVNLCREAGLFPEGPLERTTPRQRAQVVGRRRAPLSAPRRQGPSTPTQQEETPPADFSGPDYRLVAALMQQLPKDGKWTRERRDRWVQALSASVDLLVEVTDKDQLV